MNDRPDHLLSNNPPPAETAAMEMSDILSTYRAELDDRILPAFSEERLVVTDNFTIGATADKIAIARDFWTRVDNRRKEVKVPYDRATEAIQSQFAGFMEPLLEAVARAEAAIRKCRDDARERARKAAEEQAQEEARLRALRDAAKPKPENAPGPDILTPETAPVRAADIQLGTARGELGSKVSDQAKREWRITDPRKLPDDVLNAPAVQKAMLQAVKQLARLKSDIPGAAFEDTMGDKIRRAG